MYRTPVHAIWLGALLAFLSTLYTPAFLTLAAGCAVFLYISYAMPVAAGLLAEGKSWTKKGPFQLGAWSRPLAMVTVLGAAVLFFIGVQPPNDDLLNYTGGLLAIMAVLWFGVARKRFPGPPVGDSIAVPASAVPAVGR
jgi:amino acid transporter